MRGKKGTHFGFPMLKRYIFSCMKRLDITAYFRKAILAVTWIDG
jgi:hypothetical protein